MRPANRSAPVAIPMSQCAGLLARSLKAARSAVVCSPRPPDNQASVQQPCQLRFQHRQPGAAEHPSCNSSTNRASVRIAFPEIHSVRPWRTCTVAARDRSSMPIAIKPTIRLINRTVEESIKNILGFTGECEVFAA